MQEKKGWKKANEIPTQELYTSLSPDFITCDCLQKKATGLLTDPFNKLPYMWDMLGQKYFKSVYISALSFVYLFR